MSRTAHSRTGYGAATRALGTPRELEYGVFARVTGALNAASPANAPFDSLVAAVHDNARLWTLLLTDLMDEGNGLPAGLRGQLASLAIFVRRHSAAVLRREADPAVLVEINTAIMRGLRGTPAADPGAV